MLTHDFREALDERHGDHSEVGDRSLLESREDATTLLPSANETFNNISTSIRVAVEFDRASITVFVGCTWEDGVDTAFKKGFIDPLGSISFVARQRDGLHDLLRFGLRDAAVFKSFRQACGFVDLPWSQVDVQGITLRVTDTVDFGAKPAPRTT